MVQPERLGGADAQAQLAAYRPDVMVVAAYGLILPPAVLAIPTRGCLNIHASLLPRWRGAAPIQRAIEAGDAETGISLMEMEAGLDTGPVVATRATPIEPDDTGATIHDRLAGLGAGLLVDTLDGWLAGTRPATPQAHTGVTHAAKISADEARIDWWRPAVEIERRIRAFDPWPVVRCQRGTDGLRIWQAEAIPDTVTDGVPGTVIAVSDDGIDVQTGDGRLRLQRIQAPGRRVQPVADFLRGHPVYAGETLD